MAKLRVGLLLALCVGGPFAGLAGCRGGTSGEPPVHLQRNMFTQDKGRSQRENEFFEDRRTMRPEVEGTVPAHAPLGNDRFYQGKDENGQFVTEFPMAVTPELMTRGQQRFNIFCAPCHDRTGSGQGIVIQRAAGQIIRPPSYHEDRIRQLPVGQLFDTITHGVRTMPSYSYQVPIEDRWAIVAYVRALQRSQGATLADVPPELRSNLK